MDVQHQEEGPAIHSLTVTVEADMVERAYDAAHRRVAREVKLPGFRPGHAPMAMIARTHAAQIGDQVRQQLVEGTLPQALTQTKLSPLARPEVTAGEVRRGALFTYTARIEVLPPVIAGQLEGLQIVVPPATPGADADAVAAQLEIERQEHAELRPAEGRSEVADGDTVAVDIDARDGAGRPVKELQARQLLIDTGDRELIEGLVSGLLGAQVPGSLQLELRLPATYQPARLAGRRVQLTVQLHELKERFTPPLDDALAQDHGHADLAAWTQKVTTALATKASEAQAQAREEAVMAALVAANPVALPDSLVAMELDSTLEHFVKERGMAPKNLPSAIRDELRAALESSTRQRLAAGLLVEQVVRDRQIEVDEAALDADIAGRAAAAGDEGEQVRSRFDDPQRRARLREHLTHRKVVELLLAHAVETAGPPPSDPGLTLSGATSA